MIMMMMRSAGGLGVLFFILIATVFHGGLVGGASLAEQCGQEFQKVTACLPFATAKAPSPSKECCNAVTDIKDSDPACLCFIIQQIHNGTNAQLKSMGLQEARLLQLPSACKLGNVSISDCPKLLKLPPNSPDAAVFTNSSATTTTTPSATPGTSSSPTTANNASNGFSYGPQLIATAIAILFSLLSQQG